MTNLSVQSRLDSKSLRRYVLYHLSSGYTAIGLLVLRGGPTLPDNWALVATADFNGDSKPDHLLYNGGTRQTAIWYLNNNAFVSGTYGQQSLPAGP